MNSADKKIWTVTEAAKILDIDRTTLYARAYRAKIVQRHVILLSDNDLKKLAGPTRKWSRKTEKNLG
jgi:hypothetical protein